MMHNFSDFDSSVASFSASYFGVVPTMPFSSLADPDASSVADLLKSIPGVTYTPRGGVILPDSALMLGELCGDFLHCQCTNEFCSLIHPPYLLLAGAVCSLMTSYCQPKGQPQSSLDLAGGKGTQSRQEKNKKLSDLFQNNKNVQRPIEPITTDEEFVRYCSEESVQQLCDGPGPIAYLYYDASEIYSTKPSLEPFHELAEDVVNKYNSEQNENVEVKKVLKANWMTMYFYMTIEVWDNKTKRDRTVKTGVWVKGWGNFVIGFFKDVAHSSLSNVS